MVTILWCGSNQDLLSDTGATEHTLESAFTVSCFNRALDTGGLFFSYKSFLARNTNYGVGRNIIFESSLSRRIRKQKAQATLEKDRQRDLKRRRHTDDLGSLIDQENCFGDYDFG